MKILRKIKNSEINNIDMKDNKEIRTIEFRATDSEESNKIEGYASIFDSMSEYMGFYEVIDKGAFDDVINNSDVILCIDHDDTTILARNINGEGSLHLEVDEHGLKFSAELDPTNERSAYLISALKRGDIRQCSFAFADVDDEWTKDEEGNDIRHIKRIGYLYDVSAVVHPAYSDTSVALRSLSEHKQKIEEMKKTQINNIEAMNAEREQRFAQMIADIYSI